MSKKYKVDFDKYKVLPLIKKLLDSGRLKFEELERLNSWKELVEEKGISELSLLPGWGDVEERSGKYKGYRSSLLGVFGKRVVYEVIENNDSKLIVIIAVVTVDTNYYGNV